MKAKDIRKLFTGGGAAVEERPQDTIPPIEEPPEPEVDELPLTSFHPAAIQVCLSCYFGMKYNELKPELPYHLIYDNQIFHAEVDRQTHTQIILHIKKDPFGGSQIIAKHVFPMSVFDDIYLEVPE